MSSNTGGIRFFKTTVIGGLVFLVPQVVFVAVRNPLLDHRSILSKPGGRRTISFANRKRIAFSSGRVFLPSGVKMIPYSVSTP